MIEPARIEHDLVNQLLEALQQLPGFRAELSHADDQLPLLGHTYDARVDLHGPDGSLSLLVEAKRAVYPRDVRQVLWQFRDLTRKAPIGPGRKTQSLLVAESISPGAKELLRAEGVGYFDSGGSLFLPSPGAYVYIDKPPPKTLERAIRSVFSGRRAQVLHALLVHHRDWFGVTDIAKRAQVAPSTASEVLSQLDRFDWLASRGQGPSKERQLRNPAALLDAWAKQLALFRPPTMHRYYVPGVKTDPLIERLADAFEAHHVYYAISYEAAAQRYAPFLTGVSQVRTRMLAGPSAGAAVAAIGARAVNEGSNLAIIETKSAGDLLFREQVRHIWLASPIQVYLDLLRGEGRSRELAEHLRKERIQF